MNTQRLEELIIAWEDEQLTPDELTELKQLLAANPAARQRLVESGVMQRVVAERASATANAAKLDRVAFQSPEAKPKPTRWLQWRPLWAAAAGLVIGTFCSSVVYGFVAPRLGVVKKVPLVVFDPGLEGMKRLDTGLPHGVDEWGVRSARIVSAENGVRPFQGQRMLRMEPILLGDLDEKRYSRAYQVLDLRSLSLDAVSGTVEAQVTASFCASQRKVKARYVIRAVALNEPPGTATEGLWSKAEDTGVVSLTQRFETKAGDIGWHPFSVKMPLPHGAQSLVIILSAISPKDETTEAPVRYLDDVQVSLLISTTALP